MNEHKFYINMKNLKNPREFYIMFLLSLARKLTPKLKL